jgi:hypothetical protein
LTSFKYSPIIMAVNPTSIVNAAKVRFKASLLVPLFGFSVALNPATNYTFPTQRFENELAEDGIRLARYAEVVQIC